MARTGDELRSWGQSPARPAGSGERGARRRFGVICVLAYVALSWMVRFDMRLGRQIASLVYPLDTFSMYSPMAGTVASHLLIRDAQGKTHRVLSFRSFDCREPASEITARCAETQGIEYHFDDLMNYLRDHPGPGDMDVELITRTWRLRDGSPPEHLSDCVLSRCRVSK